MGLICIDTHAVIWGVKREATPGQEEMIDRAVAFLKECEDRKDRVMLPAVVLAELLAAVPPEDRTAFVDQMHMLFHIAPFDAQAALRYGVMYQDFRSRNNHDHNNRNPSPSRECVKADRMIAATAVARQCDALCTEDDGLSNFARGHIALRKISQMPAQPTLLSDDDQLPSGEAKYE